MENSEPSVASEKNFINTLPLIVFIISTSSSRHSRPRGMGSHPSVWKTQSRDQDMPRPSSLSLLRILGRDAFRAPPPPPPPHPLLILGHGDGFFERGNISIEFSWPPAPWAHHDAVPSVVTSFAYPSSEIKICKCPGWK